MMTKNPAPSWPRAFLTGTFALSKVMKAVPAVGDWRRIRLQSNAFVGV